MRYLRIIARLDIKAPYLIKGIQLEGVRKLGMPNHYALKYYNEDIVEVLNYSNFLRALNIKLTKTFRLL